MSTKYKDYPVYTYDEPVTYSDFSGGINTDPSNEHLNKNEMRDCLNMHYKSAALVKRPGASLLCNIKCDEELYNIQGVFLFTHKVTYIIIAADGKLFQGIYSPHATIELSRLSIEVPLFENDFVYNPIDTTVDLLERLDQNLNSQHEGFVYAHTVDSSTGKDVAITDKLVCSTTDITKTQTFWKDDIIEHNNEYFIAIDTVVISIIYPDTIIPPNTASIHWMPLSEYNSVYAPAIAEGTDIISRYYNNPNINHSLIDVDLKQGVWVLLDNPDKWRLTLDTWVAGRVVMYNDKAYVCIQDHCAYTNLPGYSQKSTEDWSTVYTKKELIFQNYKKIEAATYNNKMYLATGTKFVQVELEFNQLKASIVTPHKCSTEEIINIGYNYLSPYPELCRETKYNQVITSIGGLLCKKTIGGNYLLQPLMNFANNETEQDYFFKWEKRVGDDWYTVHSYKDNIRVVSEENKERIKQNLYTIEVTDADKYQYRVSFAKSFEQTSEIVTSTWDYNKHYNTGDKVSITDENNRTTIYRCVESHDPRTIIWDNVSYTMTQQVTEDDRYYDDYVVAADGTYCPIATPTFAKSTSTKVGRRLYVIEDGQKVFDALDTSFMKSGVTYWQEDYIEEPIVRLNPTDDGDRIDTDWTINKIDGEYFGSATSILASDIGVNDTYTIIQSCTKITTDGNKFLIYGDRYNSGNWYKTIISNPTYITDRGGLSFKTNKNEELIKVVPFNGNIIAFANSDTTGGSIHLVTGNGDDYDTKDGYYSPYRKSIINVNISCDNPNTIQVCENILVFKYFDTLYYIAGSELNNEVVSVYSCNDKIKHNNNFIQIPWDDNDCISEVTEDYYALIWKDKFIIENDDLVLQRPALKIKMYYKLGQQQNEKIVFPWLRDESQYFNIDHILYIKGKPVYLYNNTLTTFNENIYTDYGKNYKCCVHFRGEDINYPKMYKLIHNILVYYHRNQYSKLDFELVARNEAGHILLDSSEKRFSLSDLRALKTGDTIEDGSVRLDSTILDSKVFNTAYMFPCLLVDTTITAENDKEFSISSVTYNYTTSEPPDMTSYDLYANILRPKEVN